MVEEFKGSNVCVVEGIQVPIFFSKDCFRSALRFEPKSGDIFIVTYPKCGTTWMQNVVLNILRRGEPLERPEDFFLASPFLDQLGAEDSETRMIRPGAYKTHLPFEKVPWSDDAKYIYVARNPKDCCVSFFHHMRQLPVYQFSHGTFDDFFDLFITGNLEFGDYFQHFLSWYEQRKRPNIFFTTYEDMKNDLQDVVLKVAQFLRNGETQFLRKNTVLLNKILHSCSFQEMKYLNALLSRLYQNADEILRDPKALEGRKHILAFRSKLPKSSDQKIDFVRKGAVGDWKTIFTPDQNRRMDEKIKMINHCDDVMAVWNKIV